MDPALSSIVRDQAAPRARIVESQRSMSILCSLDQGLPEAQTFDASVSA